MHILGTGASDQNTCHLQMLFVWLTTMKHRANLEQRHICKAARLVAGCCLQQARQEIGAHMAHFTGDWVLKHGDSAATTKHLRGALIDKAIADAFVIAQRRRGTPRDLLTPLYGRQDRFWHATLQPWQGFALKLGQGCHPRHLFNQIGLTHNIGAPTGHMRHVPLQIESERG